MPTPPWRTPSSWATWPTAPTVNVEPASEMRPTALEPEESTQILQLEHDRIARVLLQIPYGTQALPHRADPVDARDQQRETGDEPDGAGVVGEGAQVELLGDARDLAADGVLCSVRRRSGDSSEAPTAAKTASIGKIERKLVKVMDAASLLHFRSVRCSHTRQRRVRKNHAAAGPIKGSFVSQSMIVGYPLSGLSSGSSQADVP